MVQDKEATHTHDLQWFLLQQPSFEKVSTMAFGSCLGPVVRVEATTRPLQGL